MMRSDPLAVAADLEVVDRIRNAAVRLINDRGVAGVTVPVVCEAAGVDPKAFAAHFGAVEDVFVEIARFMMAAYGAEVGGTLVRRRSLFQSIRIAQLAFFDVVQRHRDTQLALTALRVAAVGRPAFAVPQGSDTSLQQQMIVNSELWLLEMSRVHDVTWEVSPRVLATVVSASLSGIVLDYLSRGDAAACQEMIDVVAFDLARRARRHAKNGAY